MQRLPSGYCSPHAGKGKERPSQSSQYDVPFDLPFSHAKHNHDLYIYFLHLHASWSDLLSSLMSYNPPHSPLWPATSKEQEQLEPGLPITEITSKLCLATWLIAMTSTTHRVVQQLVEPKHLDERCWPSVQCHMWPSLLSFWWGRRSPYSPWRYASCYWYRQLVTQRFTR